MTFAHGELAQARFNAAPRAVRAFTKPHPLDEAHFVSAFEHAAIGMALVSLRGDWLKVNRATCDMLGHTQAQLLARSVYDITHPQDVAEDVLQRSRMIAGEIESYQREKRYIRRDGLIVWAFLSCSIMRDVHGEPMHFISQMQDITERKLAEQALQQSEARLRGLVALSSDWYWEQDARLRFTSFVGSNAPAPWQPLQRGILGLCRWDIPDFHLMDITWEAHRAQLDAHQSFRDLRCVLNPGTAAVRYVTVSGEPTHDEDGHFSGYRGTARDVTESVLAQQEIQRLNVELEGRVAQRTRELEWANKELEAFSYSISHDLRSSLRTIDGFTRILEMELAGKLSERGQHCVDRVRSGIKDLADLTDALLRLAKASHAAPRYEQVDLAALARRALKDCQDREPSRTAQLVVPEHLWVVGDPTLLSEVVDNLAVNAWKYTSRQARTLISVGSEPGPDGDTVYFFQDNGVGFDMAGADKLFEAFTRLPSAAGFEGHGIGLATVNRIVTHHGGRVWGQSSPGQGARFMFTLACGQPVAA